MSSASGCDARHKPLADRVTTLEVNASGIDRTLQDILKELRAIRKEMRREKRK